MHCSGLAAGPGRQSLRLREVGSSGVGWGSQCTVYLTLGAEQQPNQHSDFRPGLPARPPLCPPNNLLKGPMLGYSFLWGGEGTLTAQSDPDPTLNIWDRVPEEIRPT